jgi:hypothetical protein
MLEQPLLDARLRINCWTTAFSLALDKRKVGSDESHVVTQTAVNSVSSHESEAARTTLDTWICPVWCGPTGRACLVTLVTALCAAAPLAQAQQLPSIESLKQSYVTCVQSASVGSG